MKVLLVTQYFYPETFKSNDVAFELSRRGHDVTVLTGIPNYPEGKFKTGYGLFKNRRQEINGVKIRRSFLIPRGKGGGLRLALNYFSWAFFASFHALFLALFYKYDVIFVHQTSPVIQGIPAVLVKKIQKIPLYFWVLDLWPESLESAGGITNKRVLRFFTGIVRFLYDHSTKILISSRGFEQSILEKGNYKDKLVYFPNWAENVFTSKDQQDLPSLPPGFIVMFAGNIGEAQDFDHIMQAALWLKKEKDIHFVFVGEGRKKEWVERFIRTHHLEDTVHLLGRYPLESMPSFFARADVMLLALKDEKIFNLTVPAKLQAYMASGRPVVAMMNGEGAELIRKARCGYAVAAGDHEGLAIKIKELQTLLPDTRNQLGLNGKVFCEKNFDLNRCMDHLCSLFPPVR